MQPSSTEQLSQQGRAAIQQGDFDTVGRVAEQLIGASPEDPEGYFLRGWFQKVRRQPRLAVESFEQVLRLDERRYDAAVELATQYCVSRRNSDALRLLEQYTEALENSPRYLDQAATAYVTLGMPERAWPLYVKANELQPDIDLFQANRASCAVYLGKIDEAESIYKGLLRKNPYHQRNHYHLSRLRRVTDREHVDQMKNVLATTNLSADKNVFILYALGKELEDLGEWDEAFEYYRQAGDAVSSVANYAIEEDTRIIDSIRQHCSQEWFDRKGMMPIPELRCQPIFVVGLPRTGTTLTERMLASHSEVQSIGETQYVEIGLRQISGVQTTDRMNTQIVEALEYVDPALLTQAYYDFVGFQLGEESLFIEKLPYNFLYLGYVAKAFPDGRFVHLRRHPLDACFAMYKQVFTWAYKFSYRLEDLAEYYIAYHHLMAHWRALLGERLIEVRYEDLVRDFEGQSRGLLERLGLGFEPAVLEFDKNRSASTTASSVQVREKPHARSVDRWKHFERQLAPLAERLTAAGIAL